MRRLLTALTAISLVGTLFIGTPAPAFADDGDTVIGSAKVSDFYEDSNIVHVADALETSGQSQLYLADPGQLISLRLVMTSADGTMDDGIVDSFTLTLNNGSFGGNFTDTRVAVGTCDLTWTNTSATQRSGAVNCDEDGANGHNIAVLFFVTMPAAGPAVLTVSGAGAEFKVYFMAEQENDDIYVGLDDSLPAGAGSCGTAGPDFSTTNTNQDLTVQQAIDFALQSINEDGDTVIICDGDYLYSGDIRDYQGSDLYDGTLTVKAQTSGQVMLDGDNSYRLIALDGVDLDVEGIDFYDAEGYNGGAIYVANEDTCDGGCFVGGNLTVLDSNFESNYAFGEFGSGGSIYVEGSLTVNHASFINSEALNGGAVSVKGYDYSDEQTILADVEFDGNYADDDGGAIYIEGSEMTVTRAEFTDNGAGIEGGAIYAYDTNWSVSHSTFGSADDVHDDPDYENYADEGGDIYSGVGTVVTAFTGSVAHSKFYDSRANTGDGASLYMECTALNLSNSLFHSTEAEEDAVVFIRDHYWIGEGDYVECDDYTASISRSTFTENFAYSDGVIFVDAGDDDLGVSGILSLSVTNSLFADNVAENDEGVFDVEGAVNISIINSRFDRNSNGDNGAVIEMDGGDDDSGTTNGSLTFSRNQVRFNAGGNQSDTESGDYAEGDGIIQLDDVASWQIDYNTFQGNTADRGAVLAFEVDDDDLRDLVQLNGFRRNTIIGNSASVGGSYLFIQYNDNASNVNRASIKRIETQVKKNRNIIKGGTRPAVLQLLQFLEDEEF
jgi:predicted outer membrane repeat protein